MIEMTMEISPHRDPAKLSAMNKFTLLRGHVRRWWWFQTLRMDGRAAEARKLERESLRNYRRYLKQVHVVILRDGGYSLEYEEGTAHGSVSGYDPDFIAELFSRFAPGTPRIDNRTMTDADRIRVACSGPRAVRKTADCDIGIDGIWPGYAKCPLFVLLGIYEAFGAKVHWGKYAGNEESWRKLSAPTVTYLREIKR